jgi:hypothetical protein
MSSSASRLVRFLGPLAVAAALGVGALPAFAQTAPTPSTSCATLDFSLANPTPGARVEAGSSIISGVAMDTNAPAGSVGVDRVDFFLGNRDEGGISLGSAVPVSPTDFVNPAPFGPGSFQANVNYPTSSLGGHDLFAYAHDSVSGTESIISMPIAVGQDPQMAFGPSAIPDSQTQTCTGPLMGATSTSTTPASSSASTAPQAAMTPAPSTSAPSTSAPATGTATSTGSTSTGAMPSGDTVMLTVANPSPGDSILVGNYTLQGEAWDKASSSGSGIDSVDVFLGDRDAGGINLGEATLLGNNAWSATVEIPANQIGNNAIWVYAHSGITEQTTAVSIPITTMK